MSTNIEELRRLVEEYQEAKAERGEWYGSFTEAAIELADHVIDSALLDELERLRAIVGKLPVTADGVPVVPGMNVWVLRYPDEDTRVELDSIVVGLEDFDGYGLDRCFSTFATAEAARKEAGK